MTEENNFIVAIELGSSKVTAIAGRKDHDGKINVLAKVQKPASAFITKGWIFNVDKMVQCLTSIKESIEKTLSKTISQVYVTYGGMGIHSVPHSVKRNFSEQNKITQDVIDSLMAENREAQDTSRDIISTVELEYKVGTQSLLDPIGVVSSTIQASYLNIMAHPSVRTLIRDCFAKAGLPIVSSTLTVPLLAETVLTDSEKQAGCVFVDFGCATTTVAVYRNNFLRHFAVLPLGGFNITRDIASLQITDEDAEELKLKYGAPTEQEEENAQPITLRDGRKIAFSQYGELVCARLNEILTNVAHQIELSGIPHESLLAGIVLTGGASELKNMEKFLTEATKFEKIRIVRQLKNSRNGGSDFNSKGQYNAVLAAIEAGNENCCGGIIGEEPGLFDAGQGGTPGDKPAVPSESEIKPSEEDVNPEDNSGSDEDEPKKPSAFVTGFKSIMRKLGSIVQEDE